MKFKKRLRNETYYVSVDNEKTNLCWIMNELSKGELYLKTYPNMKLTYKQLREIADFMEKISKENKGKKDESENRKEKKRKWSIRLFCIDKEEFTKMSFTLCANGYKVWAEDRSGNYVEMFNKDHGEIYLCAKFIDKPKRDSND